MCRTLFGVCFLSALLLMLSCAPQAGDAAAAEVSTSVPTAVPSPTPSPSPTCTPTPTPEPTPDGLLGGRYPELLTEQVVATSTSYGTIDFYISLRTEADDTVYCDKGMVTYHIADVYVQDATLIRTAAADTFSNNILSARFSEIAERENALFATSGDYYNFNQEGIVVRNGELFRSVLSPEEELCVLYRDGRMESLFVRTEEDLASLLEREPWQVWGFGPSLLGVQGQPYTEFASKVQRKNPRCAIGYFEPGHYCFVVVDGRRPGHSDGIEMDALARLMSDLGCAYAYNLDGGATAQMYFDGAVYSVPTNPSRVISDIVYIARPSA